MQERRIHLLTDEEVAHILSALLSYGGRLAEKDDRDGVLFNNLLYSKIEESVDLGVIFEGREKKIEKRIS